MRDWKKTGLRLLFPPGWVTLLLAVACGTGLTVLFLRGMEEHPIAYVVYVLSFYTLVVVCTFFYKVLPGYYRRTKQKVYENPLGNRYMTDALFKVRVSLYIALGINLVYAAMNAILSQVLHTAWFMIFAVYYLILALMRFLLMRYVGHNEVGQQSLAEYRRARQCAVILLTVNLVLSGAVLMMVYMGRGFNYIGILVYVVAMYTFYSTTMAIIDLIRYRKYNSPVLTVTKMVNLAAALFSMLALETAMLTQFGADMTPANRRIMIIATGAGISAVVVGLSAYTIWRTGKAIRRLKTNAKEQ